MELHVIAFTHPSFGIKLMREFVRDKPLPFLYSGLYYESSSGWLNGPYVFPEGGRSSQIAIGLEEGARISFGPFKMNFYGHINSGLTQDQFYILASTVMTPRYVKNSWTASWGAGVRFYFPFFYERKLGVTFDMSRKSDLLSGGNWPDHVPSDNPWNYRLSLTVSR